MNEIGTGVRPDREGLEEGVVAGVITTIILVIIMEDGPVLEVEFVRLILV